LAVTWNYITMHGHMNTKSKFQFVFLMGDETGRFCNI